MQSQTHPGETTIPFSKEPFPDGTPVNNLRPITVKRNIAIVGLTTGFSALLGFIVQILVAKHFGATSAMDAFLVAFILLYFVQNQFQTGDLLNSSFIPVYNSALCESDENAAEFFSTILLSVCLTFSLLSLACLFLAPKIIHLVGPGLSSEGNALAVRIFRLFALVLPIVGLTGVLASFMRAEGKFFMPTAGPLLINLAVILMLFGFAVRSGIMSYVLGWMLGCIAQFLILIRPLLNAPGFSLKRVSLKSKHVRDFFKRMGLLLLDVPVGLTFLTLERSFGSALAVGTVSHLNYARVAFTVPLNLLAVPIQTVMFSKFAQLAALGDHAALRTQVEKTLRVTIFLILPVVVLLVFFRTEFVRLLFERGSFGGSDTTQTASLLFYFGISMLAIGIWWLFRQVAYSLGDVISPLITSLVGLIIYFLGSRLLLDEMGASALPLNWAISFFVSDLLLGGILAFKLGGGLYQRILAFSLKMGFVTGLAVLFLIFFANHTAVPKSAWSSLFYILKYGMPAVMIYLAGSWLVGIEELKEIALIGKQKLRKIRFGL